MGHVDELYAAFAGIPLRLSSHCECCTTDADVAALKARPLRELTAEDVPLISLLNTIGTAEDFLHLAPRLFELWPEGSFERGLVEEKCRQAGATAEQRRAIDVFLVEEVKARLSSGGAGPVLTPAARFRLQPWLEAQLATAAAAPRWYAQLVTEVGERHGTSAAQLPFTPDEQVLVDWVLSTPRPELLERAFFAAQGADDQRLFSLALDTLAFWAG